MLQSD